WETSPLGYPNAPETDCSVGGGRRQTFEAGTAVWHPDHGTFTVHGLIAATWANAGAEQFGHPVTDETGCPDGRGRFNHFRAMHTPGNPESSIYWTPETGAHPVYGAIRDRWAGRGWERSSVGYPLEAEHDRAGLPGREQNFEHGRVTWTPETGAFFDPLALSAPIETGGLAALGGWIAVTVNGDGSTRWQGHAHDSGADGYDFGMSAVLRASSGRALAFAHSGHVGGTFTSGSRDHDWDQTVPPHPVVTANLGAFSDGQLETHLDYSSDIGSTLEGALEWLVKWGVGSALGPVGAVVFVGLEVGSLIATGSLVPGARLAGGILWMAGPANTLLAIAAEGVASLGSRTRELTQEEYDWADSRVFSGSLPPRDQIILTDTIGGGDRAFTFPRYDGKVTLNMGAGAFDDPRQGTPGALGQTFVHELVHAWQIRHMSMELSLLADAFASKVCEATGGNPYTYGPAGQPYAELNLEQQAQVVSDWFAGRAPAGTNQTGVPADVNSPYFRYITENIRTGAV
ncbi:LGFP repeat-containing protein, partial [Streptomyces sp. NPDC056627]|uniref:LGFP repeat-containing protein n=3 Tax=unclassified Streptomyces TaxID=2593676 RepID=UPI0036751E72